MESKKDIYENLVKWKQDDTGKVLQGSGARQVVKTYILRRLDEENFKHVIYIKMAEPLGEEFYYN